MSLEFTICPTCKVRHAMMRNGEMSIHSNASGVRCDGSGDPRAYKRRLEEAQAPPQPSRNSRSKQRKREGKAAREHNAILRHEASRDPERQAAYDLAAEKLHRRYGVNPTSSKLDRRIYGVKGGHTVSGGLPSHGKRS